MPSYRNLTVLLTLAACEHAAPSATAQEPRLEPAATEQPKPAPEAPVVEAKPPAVAPAPEAPVVEAKPPAVAPVTKQPAIIKPKAPTAYELDRKCMSRAGCRWEKEEPKPRVQKLEEKP